MRVLFVSCFFPPAGGGGVQRILKLLKYLPELGWDAEVVAADDPAPWIRDESLLAQVSPGIAIHRVPLPTPLGRMRPSSRGKSGGARPTGHYDRLRKLASWAMLPDGYLPWVPATARRVRRLLRTGRFDALVTTSPPDSAHLVGLLAGNAVPWIADFRDPWTQRIHHQPPTAVHRAIDRTLERQVLRGADRVVVVTPNMESDFVGRHPDLAQKIDVVTNGFDPSDFPEPAARAPRTETLELLHAGTLTLKRTVDPLVNVLLPLFKESPELSGSIRVTILGGWDDRNEATIQGAGLGHVFRLEPSVDHGQALVRQSAADALLLLDAGGPGSELTVPGKLYEYLGAQRPILAFGAPGGVGRILAETGAGACFDPDDPLAAVPTLRTWIQRWSTEGLRSQIDPEAVARYHRKRTAAQFARILDTTAR